jgi:hypothetical protein
MQFNELASMAKMAQEPCFNALFRESSSTLGICEKRPLAVGQAREKSVGSKGYALVVLQLHLFEILQRYSVSLCSLQVICLLMMLTHHPKQVSPLIALVTSCIACFLRHTSIDLRCNYLNPYDHPYGNDGPPRIQLLCPYHR